MCGIVGLIDVNGVDHQKMEGKLTRALSYMAKRGPDAEGRWAGSTCLLGHRRLAILDLTAAAEQPMRHGPLVLVYNGEIYNFVRLRRELEALGHRFSTRSDTEVLLQGWRHWGADLLPRLEGMFAFAIWSEDTRELFLARDRMGKKPLFYACPRSGSLLFSSDLRALEQLSGRAWDLDEVALRHYFALRWLPEPRSFIQGVHKLLPGHVLRFADGRADIQRWSSPPAAREEPIRPRQDAARELLSRLDGAVADRMVADVPVGIFLSGGLDSAAVAASAAAQGVRPVTFTVRFPDDRALDEGPAAALLARDLGADHREIHLTGREVTEGLHSALAGLDEPFADASALPMYLLCSSVRDHATVLLSGDGGDEVLGGYRKYVAERYAMLWSRIPPVVRRRVGRPLANGLVAIAPSESLRTSGRRFLDGADTSWATRQIGWMRQCGDGELERLFVRPVSHTDLCELFVHCRPNDTSDEITALLRSDQVFSLPGQMLVKVDRMSMAASKEVRSPFLDSRVVDFANALPGTWKVGYRNGKMILRDALAARLPARVFALPKRGFDPPLVRWLRSDLAGLVEWASDRRRIGDQGLFRPQIIDSWKLQLNVGNACAARKLWTLVCFQYWAAQQGHCPA